MNNNDITRGDCWKLCRLNANWRQ